MTTEADDLIRVSERQLLALDVLAAGGSHAEAAGAAHVHRVTVTTWSNHHPGFQAERSRRLQMAADASCERAKRAVMRAVEVVSDAIEHDDLEAAFALLKWIGPETALKLTFEGNPDPEAILYAEAQAEAAKKAPNQLDALMDQLAGKPPPPSARRAVEERHRTALGEM